MNEKLELKILEGSQSIEDNRVSIETKLPPIVSRGMQNPTPENIQMMVDQCSKGACLLCGGAPHAVLMFTSPDQEGNGTPIGKVRQMFYSVCKHCIDKPDTFKEIENILAKECQSIKWSNNFASPI